jgi:hypothetical protein
MTAGRRGPLAPFGEGGLRRGGYGREGRSYGGAALRRCGDGLGMPDYKAARSSALKREAESRGPRKTAAFRRWRLAGEGAAEARGGHGEGSARAGRRARGGAG